MTDAKELLAEIDGLATTMFDSAGTQIDTQAELLKRARDWIERWAPLVEAVIGGAKMAREYQQWCNSGDPDALMPNSARQRAQAKMRVDRLIAAALGEK